MYALAKLLNSNLSRPTSHNQQHNKGALGVFTRTGGTIGLFGECRAALPSERALDKPTASSRRVPVCYATAGVATVFTYVDQQVANVRGTDDALNGAA